MSHLSRSLLPQTKTHPPPLSSGQHARLVTISPRQTGPSVLHTSLVGGNSSVGGTGVVRNSRHLSAVNVVGSAAGFEYYDPENLQSRSIEEQLNLSATSPANTYGLFETGQQNSVTSTSEFDLIATQLDAQMSGTSIPNSSSSHIEAALESGDFSGLDISPQQAQALLAAQVLMQSLPNSQPNSQPSSMNSGSNWLGGGNDTSGNSGKDQEDDPMAILSMSRGNSNLQAALDELESRTNGGSGTYVPGSTLNQAAARAAEASRQGNGSWHDYEGNNENGYHSDTYTSTTDNEEQEMVDSSTIPPAASTGSEMEETKFSSTTTTSTPTHTLRSHGSHGHSHGHAPSIPPVVKENEREALADELPSSGSAPGNDSLMMDQSFLSSLRTPPGPHHPPTYSRHSSSASSVASNGSSPQPSPRQLQSYSPTMAQQLAAQNAALLAPTALTGRRHSGHAPLTANMNGSLSTPTQTRLLGRSPSYDSLNLPGAPPPRTGSPHGPGSATIYPNRFASPGTDGRNLHLHPSPTQEQFQQHSNNANHQQPPGSISPTNFTVKLEPPTPNQLQVPNNTPNFGRSYSHDSLVTTATTIKNEQGVDYSSGGDSSSDNYTSPGATLNRSTRGVNSIQSSEPLRGPGGARGQSHSNPGTIMLHAAASMNSTLLPHCPPGSTAATNTNPNAPFTSNGTVITANSSTSSTSTNSTTVANSSTSPVSAVPKIGAYTREERARRLARYAEKRSRRCWTKRVLYQCRKTFADGRKRVGGRFIKKQNAGCPCPDVCLPGCVHYVAPDNEEEDEDETTVKKE